MGKLNESDGKAPTISDDTARTIVRLAHGVEHDCLARTCFVRDCEWESCAGCEDFERFAGIVKQHLESLQSTPVGKEAGEQRELTIYAVGFCAHCSELARPLTRALESTGVPTGETNWQQAYGPNKVKALHDAESQLRRLLLALEEGKPEVVADRISWAKHFLEFHAEVRRKLTALAQHHKLCSAWTVNTSGQRQPCDCMCQCGHPMGEHVRRGDESWFEECLNEPCQCAKFSAATQPVPAAEPEEQPAYRCDCGMADCFTCYGRRS